MKGLFEIWLSFLWQWLKIVFLDMASCAVITNFTTIVEVPAASIIMLDE